MMCYNPRQKKPTPFFLIPVIILLCMIWINCQGQSNQSKSVPAKEKTSTYFIADQLPLIVMDTTISFDPNTNVEVIKITSTKVSTQEYMKKVLEVMPSGNEIDSVYLANPERNTTGLILINHVQQIALKVRYMELKKNE